MFVLLVGLSASLLIVAGLLEPRLLKLIAGMSPMDSLLPTLLRWPPLRKRVYARYNQMLKGTLQRMYQDSFGEIYTPLPVRVVYPQESDTIRSPSIELLDRILGEKSIDLMIIGGGGLGKSALLRELASESIRRFENSGKGVLPIFAQGKGDLLERARNFLGDHRLSDEILKRQLAQGDWFLVIDGLAETGLEIADLVKFRTEGYRSCTRLLFANRTGIEWRDEFLRDGNAIQVEPLPLDDNSLKIFQSHYEPDETKRLPEEALAVCRGNKGLYLPILVRLAMRSYTNSNNEKLQSISDIYRGVLELFAEPKSNDPGRKKRIAEFVKIAETFCLATYAKDGLRVIDCNVHGQTDALAILIKSGLVVAVDSRSSDGELNRVRFFHDSMQSYVTALAISHLPSE